MKKEHPLAFVPVERRQPLFCIFFGLSIAIIVFFGAIGAPMQTPEAPMGILSFEFAWTHGIAMGMVKSWGDHARLIAAFGLGFDFLFMPIYALAVSFGVLLAKGRRSERFANMGVWMGWLAFVAPLFDAVENYGLMHSLMTQDVSLWPFIASVCASIKFALILAGIAYGVIGWMRPKAK